MNARKELERRQRRWAAGAGVDVDARGYVRNPDTNLLTPLSASMARDFARGSELLPSATRPARIAALHSSAALVANVFDHWTGRAAAPLLAALDVAAEPVELRFEEPIPTGAPGDPPTLDVALAFASGRTLAIESKFSEWLVRRPRNKAVFKPKYFPPGRSLWLECGLPRCQALADDVRIGAERFSWLHASQLLKHALGLAVRERPFALLYLYYDWRTREAALHRAELDRFAARIAPEADFRALTYQALFAVLAANPAVDRGYLDYLRARYF